MSAENVLVLMSVHNDELISQQGLQQGSKLSCKMESPHHPNPKTPQFIKNLLHQEDSSQKAASWSQRQQFSDSANRGSVFKGFILYVLKYSPCLDNRAFKSRARCTSVNSQKNGTAWHIRGKMQHGLELPLTAPVGTNQHQHPTTDQPGPTVECLPLPRGVPFLWSFLFPPPIFFYLL